jgi:TonB family protein
MGYQALLFCPDEKTARTVTQILSELDFTVIPCTEPFAAVKKLMGEHFDAVVVDCDNEQNATLLFKSARNTPNNQSSLAVAVVEGQTGVAKAFRIGANLVLTKPINVEQAKGTLRVARGLLRKGEAAKPATPAAGTGVKPAASVPTPPKSGPQRPIPVVATTRPAAPGAPLVRAATASIPAQKAAPQPSVVASVPTGVPESGAKIVEVSEDVAATATAKSAAQTVPAPTPGVGGSPASSAGFGAASAAAPAREPKPSVSAGDKLSTVISEPESTEKAAVGGSSSPADGPSLHASSFTFGGNVSSTASAGGRSKKTLLAVAAVVLIAVGGYEAWMQWGISSGTINAPARVAAQPVRTPTAVPHLAPSAVPPATASSTVSTEPSTANSAAAPPATGSATASSDSDAQPAASDEKTAAHPSKSNAKTDSAKPSTSAPAANKAPAAKVAAQPIMIKSGASRQTSSADAQAPSMAGIAPADDGGTLPTLMGSQSQAPTPVLQTLNVSQGVSRGLLVKQVQPVYPANALRLRTEGAVQLLATISKEGDISAVKILSGDPSLAHAAAEAVKQWKYKPYLLNGEPVEIQTQIAVNFKLPN